MTDQVPLNARPFPPDIKEKAYHALTRLNVPWHTVDRGYRRWRAGHPPEVCKYGAKEQPFAVDCVCPGCIEKLIMFYFDQVSTRFGIV